MSAHVEWMDAGSVSIETAGQGEEMPDGQSVDALGGALVIAADGVLVIEGTREQLRSVARRIMDAVGR